MSQKSRHHAGRGKRDTTASPQTKKAATIVVPLDGSAHAIVALPVAKVMAELERATLHIIHVAEPILPPREVIQKLGLTPEQLRGSVIDGVAGAPAQSIARVAKERQSLYIVMCTHTGMVEPVGELGPVAAEVLPLAPCPVMLVRPERGLQPWELHRILLPHDGTPSTAIAVGPAADLARKAGAELFVLHVAVPGARRPVEPGTLVAPRYLDQPQHEWPAWTSEFLERLRRLGHAPTDMRLQLFLSKGEPGMEIVRVAKEHNTDLIVIGWHGRLEAKRAATMKNVINSTPCPILIVRVEA